MNVLSFDDYEQLSRGGRDFFVRLALEAIAKRGQFVVALAGGRSPLGIYELLKDSSIDWRNVHIFLSDEHPPRPDLPMPYWRVISEILLRHLENLPYRNVHLYDLSAPDRQAEAERYSQEIRRTLRGELFDLIMAGAGEDFHTMSLFPGSSAAEENTLVAVVERQDTGFAYTFTKKTLIHARQVLLVVVGEKKKPVLEALIKGGRSFLVRVFGQLPSSVTVYVFTDIHL